MNEEQLQKQLEEYKKLGQEDKNVDVGTLMLAALENRKTSMLSVREKRWAYLISIGVPPLGLLFAFKFMFQEKMTVNTRR